MPTTPSDGRVAIPRRRATSDGLDQQVFRLFMDDRDPNALRFLDPIVTIVHPVLSICDLCASGATRCKISFGSVCAACGFSSAMNWSIE